ncbi:MAG: hypothetical protein DSM107014_03520 [Gomphosphaeria aponina SAG 52.96 = DSM 107014]|uniref:Uncharacterized protein n=1 Tax=Gomphosphaeria aponina SAG 52.96 = DSM 107014 TaxID=1521640 RepID=A0A941GU15_9CHRO|nr:hypothetical protein [Gomphosphaeria aponina SAG 52.96 = DSM 107014]
MNKLKYSIIYALIFLLTFLGIQFLPLKIQAVNPPNNLKIFYTQIETDNQEQLQQIKRLGFDTVLPHYNLNETTDQMSQDFLANAAEVGLQVIFPSSHYPNQAQKFIDKIVAWNPRYQQIIIGWYMADEPEPSYNNIPPAELEKAYQSIKQSARNQGFEDTIYIGFSGLALSNPKQLNSLEAYKNAYDVALVNFYPIKQGESELGTSKNKYYLEGVEKMVIFTRRVYDLASKVQKPWIPVLQAFGKIPSKPDWKWRLPTKREFSAMLFQVMVPPFSHNVQRPAGVALWAYHRLLESENFTFQGDTGTKNWRDDVLGDVFLKQYVGTNASSILLNGTIKAQPIIADYLGIEAWLLEYNNQEYLVAANRSGIATRDDGLEKDIANNIDSYCPGTKNLVSDNWTEYRVVLIDCANKTLLVNAK